MLLKPKIALLIFPIIIVQIIVLIAPSFLLYQAKFGAQMEAHISDSIAQVEHSLHRQIKAIEADSLFFSENLLVNQYLRADKNSRLNVLQDALKKQFSAFMDAHPEYMEISLLMADGAEEVAALKEGVNNRSANEQQALYFKNISRSPADIEITPLLNPDNRQWVLVAARKIFQQEVTKSASKNVQAYLIIKINFDFLDYLFNYNSFLNNGFIMIHDATGVPIKVQGDHQAASHFLATSFAPISSQEKVQVRDWSADEVAYLVGRKKLFKDLFYTAGWPKSELQQLLKSIALTSLLSALPVIILSTLLLFWLLNRLLIKPILQLTLNARKMGKQKGQWTFQPTSRDELSELAETIKEMGQGLIKQTQKVHETAYIDSLTKLPNRRQFTDDLEYHYGQTQSTLPDIALLFIDLDGFKQVNDSCGHGVGDHLLVIVAERLKNVLRASDRINYTAGTATTKEHKIARLGGDEFTILLQGIKDRQSVELIAGRILRTLNSTITIAGKEFVIGASIGIAIAAEYGDSAVDLLKNADTAMYEAKARGKNTYSFFNKSAAQKSIERMEIKEALRRAINNDDLQLAYQPQICTKTGKMVGCEALVRWRQPEKGWIAPSVFIAIAEESGLILPLGRQILLKACQQIKQWQEMGYVTVPVWVNVSCVQLEQENMQRVIMDCLEKTALSPESLAIEVTESSIMQGTDSIVQLEKIQAAGVRIALDDFGTGYSSLSALRGLPIDELKIDKSFINDLHNSEDGKAIVSAIIAMAHQLNLQVVAEGVESAQELAFVKQKQVDIIQGYYFSKALPAEEFAEKLAGAFAKRA